MTDFGQNRRDPAACSGGACAQAITLPGAAGEVDASFQTLPCISLKQPYASLIFVARIDLRKIHETRGKRPFPPKYQGRRIAIHASLRFWDPFPRGLHALCVEAFGWEYRQSLPLGAVIGTVMFVESLSTDVAIPDSAVDRLAGDYGPGRFAMRLASPQPLVPPLPWKGCQGWFSVRIPAPSLVGTNP